MAKALKRFAADKPLILALPRGGVPVAFEVAHALNAELEVLLVRKIGAPGHEELALGALVEADEPVVVVNDEVLAAVEPPAGYLEAAKVRQLAEIEHRRRLYRGKRPAPSVRDRTVIVIDDGIATGATVKAALRGVARGGPRKLILAVPLAPASAVVELREECDEVVCLKIPEPFYAVGIHYERFGQTSDDEVVALLDAARQSASIAK